MVMHDPLNELREPRLAVARGGPHSRVIWSGRRASGAGLASFLNNSQSPLSTPEAVLRTCYLVVEPAHCVRAQWIEGVDERCGAGLANLFHGKALQKCFSAVHTSGKVGMNHVPAK